MFSSTDHATHTPQRPVTGQAKAFHAAHAGGPGVLDRFSVDAINQRQGAGRVRNSCHRCGATAYKTLMTRDTAGVMSPSGRYQCVQCRQVFSTVLEWRGGLPQ